MSDYRIKFEVMRGEKSIASSETWGLEGKDVEDKVGKMFADIMRTIVVDWFFENKLVKEEKP